MVFLAGCPGPATGMFKQCSGRYSYLQFSTHPVNTTITFQVSNSGGPWGNKRTATIRKIIVPTGTFSPGLLHCLIFNTGNNLL